jgi:hypothetical protein
MHNRSRAGQAKAKIEREIAIEKSKAEAAAPFLATAKEALDEGNKLNSAAGIGVSYQKYNDQLVEFSAKVNNVTGEMSAINIDDLIPGASDICRYISESLTHYTRARDHWHKRIVKQDTPKTEKMLQLEWVAAQAALGLAGDLLRLSVMDHAHKQKSKEDENAPKVRLLINRERLKHGALLASSSLELDNLLRYGYSESEVANMIAYLDKVVLEARQWSEARERMVVDPVGEPVERKFQRRREAITAPLNALKKVLQATEEESGKKLQQADTVLKSAKAQAASNPHESDLLRNAEDAHKRNIAQQNEAIEMIQARIQDELKNLNP